MAKIKKYLQEDQCAKNDTHFTLDGSKVFSKKEQDKTIGRKMMNHKLLKKSYLKFKNLINKEIILNYDCFLRA